MPATLEVISQDALVLPPEQRLTLVCRLLDSVDLEPESDTEVAWQEEITRRLARLDAGKAKTVPANEVFARLRQIAPDQ